MAPQPAPARMLPSYPACLRCGAVCFLWWRREEKGAFFWVWAWHFIHQKVSSVTNEIDGQHVQSLVGLRCRWLAAVSPICLQSPATHRQTLARIGLGCGARDLRSIVWVWGYMQLDMRGDSWTGHMRPWV